MNLIISIFAAKSFFNLMETKVVLITGASAGIGLSAATQLMERGVRVYAASRRGGNSQKASSGVGELIPVKMDVNQPEEIASVVAQILKENNRLDAVICNAGNGIAGSIEDTSNEEMRYQLETNFFGAVNTINACLPVFRSQGYGKVIATSSVAAVVPIPFQAFYSAGKAALSIFMQALAIEVKPFGIQCCTILPGDTKTDFTSARKYAEKSQSTDSVYYQTMKKSVGRMEKDEQNGMEARIVAKQMADQAMRKSMKVTVVPGFQYKVICWLFKILPTRISLWVVGLLYG
ncbi:short-chain dehydrogenase/reductase SDR [Paludibacter propionicigenes WB4]|uniref:Short-chain dehydrogenase/reductase SDR n=2 Tax=Paludibacter TaxID=346096 RepID=E4T672_PALPW|nr:short-chain dehydrogenase/reductase SDR [Paludibacter propionicigenes WB4]